MNPSFSRHHTAFLKKYQIRAAERSSRSLCLTVSCKKPVNRFVSGSLSGPHDLCFWNDLPCGPFTAWWTDPSQQLEMIRVLMGYP